MLPRVLFEVVLFTPAETVLEPWIKRAPNEDAKQWLTTVFRNWLTKSPENLYKLPYLPVNADEKQKKAYSFNDLYDIRLSPNTEGELEHIMDFFDNNPNLPRLSRMSVEAVLKAADDWVKAMNAKAKKQPDNPKFVKTVMEFPGGYRMVDLIGKTALEKEGSLMGHCVGGQTYWDMVKSGEGKIYSLRDSNNQPHVTIEVKNSNNSTEQIKGVGNQAPSRRYWPMLRDFFQKTGIKVEDDYRNVGFLRIYDGENWVTTTQDQFKDMVLDPQNQEGQKLLQYYNDRGGAGGDFDLSMGMFTALYGTPRLGDGVVKTVFNHMPIESIQVVEQFGNKLTPQQVVAAFMALPKHRNRDDTTSKLYNRLLIATKPNNETLNEIIAALTTEADEHYRLAQERNRDGRSYSVWRDDYEARFVSSLAHATPELYRNLLSDPINVKQELDQHNERRTGPFYVFVGSPDVPANIVPLIPEIIRAGFSYGSDDAVEHIKKTNYVFDDQTAIAALEGFAGSYWSNDDKKSKPLSWLVEYIKPNKQVVETVFNDLIENNEKNRKNEFAKAFLHDVEKIVPQSIDQETKEKALSAINDIDEIKVYLNKEKHPTLAFQTYLFNRKDENGKLMTWVKNVDPSFFSLVATKLRPDPIDPKEEDHKNVPDKQKRASGKPEDKHATKQIKIKRDKTPEEKTKAIEKNRRAAISRFLSYLGPLLRDADPLQRNQDDDVADYKSIDPKSRKFRTGQKAFAQMGKSKLFDLTVKMLDNESLRAKIIGSGGRYSGWSGQSPPDPQTFLKHLDKMHDRDVVRIIDSVGYNNDLFPLVINHDPQRIPRLMVAQKFRHMVRNSAPQWGDLTWKNLDKTKTLEALEYVWASPNVPENFKDDFTLKVFKRFKPPAGKLMQMLKTADSEFATEYVLKKTKNPTEELLNYVVDEFPNLLYVAKNIPDAVLTRLFKEHLRSAIVLMNRDLRDYGPTSRRTYASTEFQSRIDPESEMFAKYQAAAHAAGREKEFARYVMQAQLDDQVRHGEFSVSSGESDDKRRDGVDVERVITHADDFSMSTLVKAAQAGTEQDQTKLIQYYFKHFSPEKLAKLAQMGVFKKSGWSHEYIWATGSYSGMNYVKKRRAFLRKLDQEKLMAMLKLLLAEDKKNDGKNAAEEIFEQLKAEKVQISDDLLKAYLLAPNVKKEPFIDDSLSDEMKDFVADNLPREMEHIDTPTPHMVAKLFDEFGDVDEQGKVNYFFTETVKKWLGYKSYFFEQNDVDTEPNPHTVKMLKAEAMKRRGVAVAIIIAIFRRLAALKKKMATSTERSYTSFDSPKIRMINPKWLPKKKQKGAVAAPVEPEDDESSE